jgi:hypothetical protein
VPNACQQIYSDFRLPQYPSLSSIITQYSQGSDAVDSIGPYAQRPGRTIVDNHLVDIPDPNLVLPSTKLTKMERVYFTGTLESCTTESYRLTPLRLQDHIMKKRSRNHPLILPSSCASRLGEACLRTSAPSAPSTTIMRDFQRI